MSTCATEQGDLGSLGGAVLAYALCVRAEHCRAARVEVGRVDLSLNLQADPVTQADLAEPICVEPGTSIRLVLAELRERKAGSILICRDGKLCGIFTERDALRLMAHGADLSQPVETVMTADPVTLQANASVASAIGMMAAGGYRRLPIVDQEHRPTGVLQVPGIVRYLVEHFPRTIYNLPPNPHVAMQQREGP